METILQIYIYIYFPGKKAEYWFVHPGNRMSIIMLLHGKGNVRESDKVPIYVILYNCVLPYAWPNNSNVVLCAQTLC